MAIVRSSLGGRVRKSIGETNYYVRAGVQMSRQKPSFSPDRQFTALQLLQQYRMKVVKAARDAFQLDDYADLFNAGNNKRYNASSRINRLVGHLLKNLSSITEDTDLSVEEFLKSYFMDMIPGFAIGNILNPINSISLSPSSNTVMATLTLRQDAVSRFLEIANYRRSPSNLYTESDMYFAGFLASPAMNNGGRLIDQSFPTLNYSSGQAEVKIAIGNVPNLESNDIRGEFVVYLYKSGIEGTFAGKKKPRFSSSSIGVDYVADDGPIMH